MGSGCCRWHHKSPEGKFPVELMAIPTCQMDPMLLHHLQLMGAIHTHLLLQTFILVLLQQMGTWATCSFHPHPTQGPWSPLSVAQTCPPLLQLKPRLLKLLPVLTTAQATPTMSTCPRTSLLLLHTSHQRTRKTNKLTQTFSTTHCFLFFHFGRILGHSP